MIAPLFRTGSAGQAHRAGRNAAGINRVIFRRCKQGVKPRHPRPRVASFLLQPEGVEARLVQVEDDANRPLEDPVVLSLPNYLRAQVIAADRFANDGEARETSHGFPIDDFGKRSPPIWRRR